MVFDLSSQHTSTSASQDLTELAAFAQQTAPEFDSYGTGSTLQQFEANVAQLFGFQKAIFAGTGTGAQQAVLAFHTADKEPSVLLHGTSHLVYLDCLRDGAAQQADWDTNVTANMPGYSVKRMGEAHRALSFADVEEAVSAGVASAMVIELPQRMNGGAIISWTDLQKVSQLCRARGIALHCDGARVWEAQPYYGVPFQQIGALFDTLYVSFYKGVGAWSGAMVVCPEAAAASIKSFIKRRGGDLHCRGPLALHCEMRLSQLVAIGATAACHTPSGASFSARLQRLREMAILVHQEVKKAGCEHCVRLEPVEPQGAMLHVYLKGDAQGILKAHEAASTASGVRVLNHLRGPGHSILHGGGAPFDNSSRQWQYFEWNCGCSNIEATDRQVRQGWSSFLAELTSDAAHPAEKKRKR